VLYLPRGDHHHRQARVQQRPDEHPVATLYRDLADPGPAQPGDQRLDPGLVMGGSETVLHPPAHADHARDVIGGGPVDASAHLTSRDIGQNPN
jgi:hypothetical protein